MEALLASLPPGYLRCCLAFLNGNAKSVLSDNAVRLQGHVPLVAFVTHHQVQLSHRLAFAAHYLPDDDLVNFIHVLRACHVPLHDACSGEVFGECQRLGCKVRQFDGAANHRPHPPWR
jgi:hypothetical protein